MTYSRTRNAIVKYAWGRWLIRRHIKAKFALASARNYRSGFAWGPVQRCRECEHTTPYHYATCNQDGAA